MDVEPSPGPLETSQWPTPSKKIDSLSQQPSIASNSSVTGGAWKSSPIYTELLTSLIFKFLSEGSISQPSSPSSSSCILSASSSAMFPEPYLARGKKLLKVSHSELSSQSQNVGQLCISALMAAHWEKKLLWWGWEQPRSWVSSDPHHGSTSSAVGHCEEKDGGGGCRGGRGEEYVEGEREEEVEEKREEDELNISKSNLYSACIHLFWLPYPAVKKELFLSCLWQLGKYVSSHSPFLQTKHFHFP